jgi:4-amino-4-deoxy-L-arabinose transferase-like glycosyltransferase
MKLLKEFWKNKEKLIVSICFLLLFIFYFILIFLIPKNQIYGDEIFFYDQAKKIYERGEFVNFQNTQPLLYPLFLSLFYKNIIVARLVNILLMLISSFLLFLCIRKNFDLKTALFGTLIFALNPLTIMLAVSLYTEALFTFLLLLSFLIFDKIKKSNSYIVWICFGILLGLLSEARVTGLLVALFFFIYATIKQNLKLQYFLSLITAILLFIPYLALGGINFLFEKQMGVYFDFIKPIIFIGKFLWPMFLFLFFGIYYKQEKNKKEFVLFHLFFVIAIFILLTSFTAILFERHLFILFPSLTIITAAGFYSLLKRKKLLKIFIILLFLSCFFYFFIIFKLTKLPNQYYQQSFYLQIPKDCIEIKEVNATSNFKIINKTLIRNNGISIDLPYLNQPSGQTLYFFKFLPKENYSHLILKYADDVGIVIINNTVIGHIEDIYREDIFEYNFTASEPVEIDILIENIINVGGIGQILICKK